MTRHVHVAAPLTPFKVLLRVLDENRIGAIPIVDQQGKPIGIVSAVDLVPVEASGTLRVPRRRGVRDQEGGAVASDAMTSPPVTIAAGAQVSDALRLMDRNDVGRLVVVDAHGRIAGMVSRSDLLHVWRR